METAFSFYFLGFPPFVSIPYSALFCFRVDSVYNNVLFICFPIRLLGLFHLSFLPLVLCFSERFPFVRLAYVHIVSAALDVSVNVSLYHNQLIIDVQIIMFEIARRQTRNHLRPRPSVLYENNVWSNVWSMIECVTGKMRTPGDSCIICKCGLSGVMLWRVPCDRRLPSGARGENEHNRFHMHISALRTYTTHPRMVYVRIHRRALATLSLP